VFRRHGATYRQAHAGTLGRARLRVMRAIELCRTAALGGHVEQCDACAHRRVAYNSCRNRHCPKCQALARALWLEARKADLLPVPCFHVVFTLPEPIAAIEICRFENPRSHRRPHFASQVWRIGLNRNDPRALNSPGVNPTGVLTTDLKSASPIRSQSS